MNMITQSELKHLFDYNHKTGVFTRNVKIASATKVGEVAGYKNPRGYIHMRINSKTYSAHRIAWLYVYGVHPTDLIDHIDGNPSNNAIDNLRMADKSFNGFNRQKQAKKSSSVFKGVHWSKCNKKWEVNINIAGTKRMHIGVFEDEQEAAHAYNKAAIRFHGEYASLNPIGLKGE